MITDASAAEFSVLIVEDNPGEQEVLTVIVHDAIPNCHVAVATDVKSAQRFLEKGPLTFDLAIIDLRLGPGEDGLSVVNLIKQARSRHLRTRVIVYTAYPTVESACAAYEAGADRYLCKLDVDSTEKLVRELLEMRELRDNLRREYEAQKKAEAAFRAHREEWMRKYSGKFLLVRGTEVVGAYDDPQKVWDQFERRPLAERNDLGIVAVPGEAT